MSMPPEILRAMKATIEREEAENKRLEQALDDVRSKLADMGVALHPLGVQVLYSFLRDLAVAFHDHAQCTGGPKCTMPTPIESLALADDFMMIWAQRRVAADPKFSIVRDWTDAIDDPRVMELHAPTPDIKL